MVPKNRLTKEKSFFKDVDLNKSNLIFGRQITIDSSSLSVTAHILNIRTLWVISIETDSDFTMKMDNWFVDEFENIGFPSRVYIDTICENINFSLFNGGWVFTAELKLWVTCPEWTSVRLGQLTNHGWECNWLHRQ